MKGLGKSLFFLISISLAVIFITIINSPEVSGRSSSSCFDSDKGVNFTVKGMVNVPEVVWIFFRITRTYTDSCYNKMHLREYFCQSNGKLGNVLYYCENGCENGACKLQNMTNFAPPPFLFNKPDSITPPPANQSNVGITNSNSSIPQNNTTANKTNSTSSSALNKISPVSPPLDFCKEILFNGASDKKVDIVFIPDGYSSKEKWISDVSGLVDLNGTSKGFFSVEPMKSNKNKFNVWRIDVMNKSYWDFNYNQLSLDKKQEILDLVERCVNYNMLFIVVNNSNHLDYDGGFGMYEDSAALIYSLSGNSDGKYLSQRELLHEFGHGFVNLGDEYRGSEFQDFSNRPNVDVEGCPKWCSGKMNTSAKDYSKYLTQKSCLYNVTKNLTINRGNWTRLCGFGDFDEIDFGIGCRTGTGCYWDAKSSIMFRSSKDSIMKFQNVEPAEFNVISRDAILRKINSLTS